MEPEKCPNCGMSLSKEGPYRPVKNRNDYCSACIVLSDKGKENRRMVNQVLALDRIEYKPEFHAICGR